MSITIGPYTQGEIPAPLEYQFQDDNGDPIEDFGDDVECSFSMRPLSASPTDATSADAEFDDETAKATYAWVEGDIDVPDVWVGEFTIDNGTNVFVSERFVWLTKAAVTAGAGS